MQIEHKTVGVSGLKVLNEDDGIVEAFVSVTGIVDNVKDIIEPGAYEKTLAIRTPKGVWSHDWDTPVSRTLAVKELMPGDPGLPDFLPNGDPWPAEAGALQVKTQFNLETQRGRDAYSDVKFFGSDQEWSIGYNVPTGGAALDSKAGVRRIKTLDLFEYSPVLFGAMPNARTAGGVKSAQQAHMAYKTLFGADYYVHMDKKSIDQFVTEMKDIIDLPDGSVVDEDGEDLTLVEEFETAIGSIDPAEFAEKSLLSASNVGLLKKAISALTDLLDAVEAPPSEETQEEKTLKVDSKSLLDVLADAEDTIDKKASESLYEHAEAFDLAVKENNTDAIEESATAILDIVDDSIDSASDEEAAGLKSIAASIHDILMKGYESEDGEPEEDDPEETPEDVEEEEETEEEEKVIFDTTEVKSLKNFLDTLS